MTVNDILMIVWLVVFIVALVVEFGTTDLVSIWFAIGAFVAFFFCISESIPWYVSLIVFIALSAVCLTIFLLFIKKRIDRKMIPTNYEAMIGKSVVIIEVDKDSKTTGVCKIGDVMWTIDAKHDITLGESLKITGVEGNRLKAE